MAKQFKKVLPAGQSKALIDWLIDNADIDDNQLLYLVAGRESAVEVSVKRFMPRHTPEQQRLYWATLRAWGEHLGYSAKESEDVLHDAVLCETFGVARTVKKRGQIREVPNKTSSKLVIEDYSKLIDTLQRMAAEDGFYL